MGKIVPVLSRLLAMFAGSEVILGESNAEGGVSVIANGKLERFPSRKVDKWAVSMGDRTNVSFQVSEIQKVVVENDVAMVVLCEK